MVNLYFYKGNTNAGDYYSSWLLNKLEIKHTSNNKDKIDLAAVGSIMHRRELTNSTLVFGSGFHFRSKDEHSSVLNSSNYIAIRGKLTLNKLKEQGISNLSPVLGDPGLLISKFYNKDVNKQYAIGVISSWQNYDSLKNKLDKLNIDGVKLIDIRTDNIEGLIDNIRSCKFILSSSLHGIIFSHSYNIPAIHLLDNEILESKGCMKYKDYYSVLDIDYRNEELKDNLYEIISKYKNMSNYSGFVPSKHCVESIQNQLLFASNILRDMINKPKHNIVVCVIAKNEHLYINEWIGHYIKLGVDRVYLFDNDDSDSKYIGNFIDGEYLSKVVIINRRGVPQAQLNCYQYFYDKYNMTFKWCLFCDVDEYLIGVDSIDKLVENVPSEIEQIRIKWNLFGDDNIVERDTKQTFNSFKNIINDNTISNQGKFVIRGGLKDIKFISAHYCVRFISNEKIMLNSCLPSGAVCNSKVSIEEDYSNETIFLNHYMTKTLSEFVNQKVGRGDARFKNRHIDLDYFWRINEKTKEKLDWIEKNLKNL